MLRNSAHLRSAAANLRRLPTLILLPFLLVLAAPATLAQAVEYNISITSRYNAQGRQPKTIREFFAANPNVHLKQWESLRMPGGAWTASLGMSMAGNRGPDIFEMDIRQAVSQNLAVPLTEWIGEDGVLADGRPKLTAAGTPDKNGQIDADEAKWDGWMKIKPIFRLVCTVDGKPYSLPFSEGTYVGILYSKRLLRKAGLDPMQPPQTWDEYLRWCRKLYNPETKVFQVEFISASWSFAPWVATTGSSINVQYRKSPTTGKVYQFNEQDTEFIAPDTHEDLQNVTPTWRCNVASPECTAAVGFYHRLRWEPWIRDPETGEPVTLTPADVTRSAVAYQGRTLAFKPEDVVEGSLRLCNVEEINRVIRRMGRDLAMYPLWSGDMTEFASSGVEPEDVGMMPFPAMTTDQRSVLQHSNCFFMIGKDVLDRGGATPEARKAYRDRVWQLMTLITSPEGKEEVIRQKVAAGQAKFMNPRDLRRLELDDYIRQMPPENRQLWADIEAGKFLEIVEPFTGRWLQFREYYQREAIDLVLRPSGKDFDYKAALQQLERDANTGIMYERPPEQIEALRPKARLIVGAMAAFMAVMVVLIIRSQLRRKPSLAGVYKGWLPWIMMAPALVSITLWGYYPLGRGLVMAFQDYRIAGKTALVGLTNFIAIGTDPNFFHYIFTTFRFVLWNLFLAFFTPIFLALLLAEVPRLKVLFRTLFFLPQMTSGLVVTLMWKDMYVGTASGTINRLLLWLLGRFGFQPIDWLGNPSTVMACVIIPGIWAGAGISSLIYLAALKSVPEDLYEAASVDGLGVFGKVRHITLPTIAPLVLINFVGAFIGTFQTMGHIFLLTFGGPGKETMVMSLAIWQEAYVNLRFSLASAYAWILGSMLMGFTYLQLQILRRVDFRQAKGV
jgi:multiple sugar transport system permease protein